MQEAAPANPDIHVHVAELNADGIVTGTPMCEANGLASVSRSNLHVPMVELITITESCYACGVSASMHGTRDQCGGFMSEPVFSNNGKRPEPAAWALPRSRIHTPGDGGTAWEQQGHVTTNHKRHALMHAVS